MTCPPDFLSPALIQRSHICDYTSLRCLNTGCNPTLSRIPTLYRVHTTHLAPIHRPGWHEVETPMWFVFRFGWPGRIPRINRVDYTYSHQRKGSYSSRQMPPSNLSWKKMLDLAAKNGKLSSKQSTGQIHSMAQPSQLLLSYLNRYWYHLTVCRTTNGRNRVALRGGLMEANFEG